MRCRARGWTARLRRAWLRRARSPADTLAEPAGWRTCEGDCGDRPGRGGWCRRGQWRVLTLARCWRPRGTWSGLPQAECASRVVVDSRAVTAGALFVALRGQNARRARVRGAGAGGRGGGGAGRARASRLRWADQADGPPLVVVPSTRRRAGGDGALRARPPPEPRQSSASPAAWARRPPRKSSPACWAPGGACSRARAT